MQMFYIHYSLHTISMPAVNTGGVVGFSKNPSSSVMVDVEFVHFTFSDFDYRFAFRPKHYLSFPMYQALLLQIPASERMYDANLNMWTIRKEKFDVIFQFIESTHKIYHSDLIGDINTGWDSIKNSSYGNKKKEIPKAEDFFYHHSQPTSTRAMLSADELVAKITKILCDAGINEKDLSVAYKKAARKLHPDLNGGSADKMSELNMYWQQYKQLQQKSN